MGAQPQPLPRKLRLEPQLRPPHVRVWRDSRWPTLSSFASALVPRRVSSAALSFWPLSAALRAK
eukprot:2465013-Pleurochrysis_carterae.AAC.3